MISFSQPQPLQAAVDSVSARTPLGTALGSEAIAELPSEIRRRAFFSATVEEVRLLERMQRDILTRLRLERRDLSKLALPGGRPQADGTQGTFQRRDQFVREMQELAERYGVRPDDHRRGTIQDIGSFRRLRLIWDVQTKMAQGYARYATENSEVGRDRAPAFELIRKQARRVPRDWKTRWKDAMDELGDSTRAILTANGRMMAPKGDPIWIRISRFRQPWEPFDYNSGMGLRSVRRKVAEKFGVIKPGEKLPAVENMEFNGDVRASLRGISPEGRERLQATLGGDVVIDGDQIRLLPVDAAGGRDKRKLYIPPFNNVDQPAPEAEPALVSGAVKRGFIDGLLGREIPEPWKESLDIIDAQHKDGVLPRTRIVNAPPDGLLGTYRRSHPGTKGSQRLAVDPDNPVPRLTTAHEVGHWLDNWGLHSPTEARPYASWGQPEMKRVLDAIRRSSGYRKLEARARREGETYWLRPQELWARAYSQWIAGRSKDPVMRAELASIRRGDVEQHNGWKESQWGGLDFAPIEREITRLFKNRGWLPGQ